MVDDSRSEAVRLFESSVDHETEALRLMHAGRRAVWTPEDLAQAKFDAEQGLRDAEAVLHDKTSLVMAIQMYADQRQR